MKRANRFRGAYFFGNIYGGPLAEYMPLMAILSLVAIFALPKMVEPVVTVFEAPSIVGEKISEAGIDTGQGDSNSAGGGNEPPAVQCTSNIDISSLDPLPDYVSYHTERRNATDYHYYDIDMGDIVDCWNNEGGDYTIETFVGWSGSLSKNYSYSSIQLHSNMYWYDASAPGQAHINKMHRRTTNGPVNAEGSDIKELDPTLYRLRSIFYGYCSGGACSYGPKLISVHISEDP